MSKTQQAFVLLAQMEAPVSAEAMEMATRLHALPPLLRGLVLGIMPIVNKLTQTGVSRDLDGLEVFAGVGAIAQAGRAAGMSWETFDINNNSAEDIVDPAGLELVIGMALRVRASGALWGAVPCSTWVWIARHGTGRTAQHPEGSAECARVVAANKVTENFVAVAAMGWLRGAMVFVENPSSLLWQFGLIRDLRRLRSCETTPVCKSQGRMPRL